MLRHVFALAALTLGCSSLPEPEYDLGEAPQNFLGFPALSHENMVNAQATFEPEYAEIFDTDLVKRRGVIPVRLQIGLRGEGAEHRNILLNPDQWEITLYLQDGTALRPVDPEELAEMLGKKSAPKVRENKFRTGFLGTEGTSGFVYFQLSPKDEFTVRDRSLIHEKGDTSRGVDLYHSLVGFNVTIDDELHPFYVGIKPQ